MFKKLIGNKRDILCRLGMVFVLYALPALAAFLPLNWQPVSIVQLIGISVAHAAIAFEQTVGQNIFYDPVNYTGTTNVAVTAGNSIIVTIAMEWWDETTPATCSDSKSNTCTLDATAASLGADIPAFICSAHNVTALTTSDTITITHSDTDARAVTVHEFSGLAASATLDRTASADGWGAAPSSGNTATTAQADELH